MFRILRGLGQTLLLWGFTASFLTAVLLIAPFAPRRHFEGFRCWAIRTWARVGLRILRVSVHLEGAEHVAIRAARIVTFNHTSLLDIFVVLALLPDGGTPIAKEEVLKYPFIGWGVQALGILPLPRTDLTKARSALEQVAMRLERDRLSIIIAPEGTRSKSGALQPFKLGAFHLALQTRVPLVPMVIENASRLLPAGSLYCLPGRVKVRWLPPLSTMGYRRENLRAEADRLNALYAQELALPPNARPGEIQ